MTYQTQMGRRSLPVSEARQRLSALVERVARGGTPVPIGRYGRERAVLIGADEYARLTLPGGHAKSGMSLEGTLTVTCSPTELIAESRRLGELWLTALDATPVRSRRRPRRR